GNREPAAGRAPGRQVGAVGIEDGGGQAEVSPYGELHPVTEGDEAVDEHEAQDAEPVDALGEQGWQEQQQGSDHPELPLPPVIDGGTNRRLRQCTKSSIKRASSTGVSPCTL